MFGCLWFIAYRDKKVVGVFVRFSCAASLDRLDYPRSRLQALMLEMTTWWSAFRALDLHPSSRCWWFTSGTKPRACNVA
jgi:hypothetical protein